jgi:hypothetical protein
MWIPAPSTTLGTGFAGMTKGLFFVLLEIPNAFSVRISDQDDLVIDHQ